MEVRTRYFVLQNSNIQSLLSCPGARARLHCGPVPGSEYAHPRDEILQVMERIYRYRMTTTSGGNISVREPGGALWITPARVDKGSLRREDIVLVRGDGSVEGRHRSSSEYPLHAAVYAARPDYTAVVHAHPAALVAFSMAHQVPDTKLFHQARHVCGAAGFAKYELPGSEQLGRTVAAVFESGRDCVILQNHGVIAGAADLAHAFHRFETLEFTARILIKARLLDHPEFLTESHLALADGAATALPQFQRQAPTSTEKEVRRTLCDFVRRAYRQRLFISTQGSFSARLDEASFLVTPYAVDRGLISAEDLVLVHDGAAESGKRGTRANRLRHQRLSCECHRVQRYQANARQPDHPRKLRGAARGWTSTIRRAVPGAGRDRENDFRRPSLDHPGERRRAGHGSKRGGCLRPPRGP